MEFNKQAYGLLAVVYVLILLTHLWPFMSQRWIAYREGRPVRDVPRPPKNRLLSAILGLLTVVLWVWLLFGQ